jgi:hypothetical protein
VRTISLVAVKDFTFQNRAYVAGEYFDATPIESAAHLYRKRAKFAPDPPAPPAPVTTETPKRRRYQRKDLRAED